MAGGVGGSYSGQSGTAYGSANLNRIFPGSGGAGGGSDPVQGNQIDGNYGGNICAIAGGRGGGVVFAGAGPVVTEAGATISAEVCMGDYSWGVSPGGDHGGGGAGVSVWIQTLDVQIAGDDPSVAGGLGREAALEYYPYWYWWA